MFHFIKYFLLALFLFAFLNFFRSNIDSAVLLRFQVPLVWEWASPPFSVNFLALVAFCAGIVFSALLGAFRMGDVRSEKKRLKQLKNELDEREGIVKSPDNLPPLA